MMSLESNSDNKGIKDGYIAEKAYSSNTIEEFEKDSSFQSKANEWIIYQNYLAVNNKMNYYYKINDLAKIALKSDPVSQNGDHNLKKHYDKFKIRSKAQYEQSEEFTTALETWAKDNKNDYTVQEKFRNNMEITGPIGDAIQNKFNEFKQIPLNEHYEKDNFVFRNHVEDWAKANKDNSDEIKTAFIAALSLDSPTGGDKIAKDKYDEFKIKSQDEYKVDDQFKIDTGEWAKTNKDNSEIKAAFIAALRSKLPTGGDKTAQDEYLTFRTDKLSEIGYEADKQFKIDTGDWAENKKDELNVKADFIEAMTSDGNNPAKIGYANFKEEKLSEVEYNADNQFKTDTGEWAKTNKDNSEVKAAFIEALSSKLPTGGDKTAKDEYLKFRTDKLSETEYESDKQFKIDTRDWAENKKDEINVKPKFIGAMTSDDSNPAKTGYDKFKEEKLSKVKYEDDDQFKIDTGEWAKANKDNNEVKADFIEAMTSADNNPAKKGYDKFKEEKLSEVKYEADDQFKIDTGDWAENKKDEINVKPKFIGAMTSDDSNPAKTGYDKFKEEKLSQDEYKVDNQFKIDTGEWAKANKDNSEVKTAFIAALRSKLPTGGDKTAQGKYLTFRTDKLSEVKYEADDQFKIDVGDWAENKHKTIFLQF